MIAGKVAGGALVELARAPQAGVGFQVLRGGDEGCRALRQALTGAVVVRRKAVGAERAPGSDHPAERRRPFECDVQVSVEDAPKDLVEKLS